MSSVTVRTELIWDALAIYTACWISPQISYECVFLWIGVKLCLVKKVMDKTQPPYSSQYLTLRQTNKNKSWNHLVCNSQEYSIQQRTGSSIFSYFVTLIHFGQTTTGHVLSCPRSASHTMKKFTPSTAVDNYIVFLVQQKVLKNMCTFKDCRRLCSYIMLYLSIRKMPKIAQTLSW